MLKKDDFLRILNRFPYYKTSFTQIARSRKEKNDAILLNDEENKLLKRISKDEYEVIIALFFFRRKLLKKGKTLLYETDFYVFDLINFTILERNDKFQRINFSKSICSISKEKSKL